ERRQQVDVRQSRERQRSQMTHSVRGKLREGPERTAHLRRQAGVASAEVAHVQLVDGDVLWSVEARLLQSSPPCRLQRRIREIDDLTARTVERQADRVRIRDEV